MSQASVRPRDAAVLILIREPRGGPEFLMGRRHRRVGFMPGVYVFPGGILAPSDRRPSGFVEDLPPQPPGIGAATERRLSVFARAALREAHEETGLLLGHARPGDAPEVAGRPWCDFAAAGLAPAFDQLRLVARAVTPRHSPRRFNTRFFLADGAYARGRLSGDGELEALDWVPAAGIHRLPLAEVTALVLQEALAHWRDRAARARGAPLFCWSADGLRPRHRRPARA